MDEEDGINNIIHNNASWNTWFSNSASNSISDLEGEVDSSSPSISSARTSDRTVRGNNLSSRKILRGEALLLEGQEEEQDQEQEEETRTKISRKS